MKTLMTIFRWQSAWFSLERLLTTGVGTPRRCKPWSRWSSCDHDDDEIWNVHDHLSSDCRSLQHVLKITGYQRVRLPHQFFEVCDEQWRKSLEPLTLEEENPARRNPHESGQSKYDESAGSRKWWWISKTSVLSPSVCSANTGKQRCSSSKSLCPVSACFLASCCVQTILT